MENLVERPESHRDSPRQVTSHSSPVWTDTDRLCHSCESRPAHPGDWLCQSCRAGIEKTWRSVTSPPQYNS
jgi:hypothetical protein